MNIYVINLDKSTERMTRTSAQLERMNLSFKRVSAVIGADLNLKNSIINNFWFRMTQRRDCTSGELGCAESHRLVWSKILKSNKPYSLILEDDVLLPENLPQVLSLIEVSKSLDIINLSSIGTYPITSGKIEFLNSINLKKRPYIKNKKVWIDIESGSWKLFSLKQLGDLTLFECGTLPPLSSAYVVTPKACKALLRASEKLAFPIDYVYRHVSGKVTQGFVFPQYVKQDRTIESQIENRGIATLTKPSILFSAIKFLFKPRGFRRKLNLIRLYGIKSIF